MVRFQFGVHSGCAILQHQLKLNSLKRKTCTSIPNIHNLLFINVHFRLVTPNYLVEVIQLLFELMFSCAILFTHVHYFDKTVSQQPEGLLI